MTPTPAELARMKPNAKGELILVDGKEIKFVFYARLGRHIVVGEGDPQHWGTKTQAEDAAKRFKAACVKASA
jgi:hypothetical protein